MTGERNADYYNRLDLERNADYYNRLDLERNRELINFYSDLGTTTEEKNARRGVIIDYIVNEHRYQPKQDVVDAWNEALKSFVYGKHDHRLYKDPEGENLLGKNFGQKITTTPSENGTGPLQLTISRTNSYFAPGEDGEDERKRFSYSVSFTTLSEVIEAIPRD